MGAVEPDVLHFSDYRVYLREFYAYQKARSTEFSYRFFGKKAGLSSPNYLKLVIDGKRNLSKRTLTQFIVGLGLKSRRAEFFENLVFFNQAQSTEEKRLFYEKLLRERSRSGLSPVKEEQFRIFTEWHHSVVREMVALADARREPEWFVSRLRYRLSRRQIQESLKLLQAQEMIGKTANGFSQREKNITTTDEAGSMLVKSYHREMMGLALRALDEVPADERDISSVTIPVRKRDFAKLKEQLQLMRKEFFNLAAEGDDAEEIVQLNFQLFPLTHSKK